MSETIHLKNRITKVPQNQMMTSLLLLMRQLFPLHNLHEVSPVTRLSAKKQVTSHNFCPRLNFSTRVPVVFVQLKKKGMEATTPVQQLDVGRARVFTLRNKFKRLDPEMQIS